MGYTMSSNSNARSFLRWVGGKAKSVSQIYAHFPPTWNPETDLYIEPFIGGGAMFFDLQPKNAILSDANERLIRTYLAIRDDVEQVIANLHVYEERHARVGEKFYYQIRDTFRDDAAGTQVAADFIFLNKAGFNGLYRVNKNNKINVPWGKKPNVALCDPENLRACSAALQGVRLMYGDFDHAVDVLELDNSLEGAIIYCDPPYVPVSKTANFTSYTSGGFTYADQIRLLAKAVDWRRQGAHVILSQAADPVLIDQYVRCGFEYEVIGARRNINSKGGARGPVDECIIF
jgi:DNA adenine methylase